MKQNCARFSENLLLFFNTVDIFYEMYFYLNTLNILNEMRNYEFNTERPNKSGRNIKQNRLFTKFK